MAQYNLPAERLPEGKPWSRLDVGCKLSVDGVTDSEGLSTQDRRIYRTLNSNASAGDINSAIGSCPVGQSIHLGAGTYNLSSKISMKSGVCLEGDGPDKTILKFSAATSEAIDFRGPWQDPGSVVTDITGGLSQGSRELNVKSATGFAVGDLVGIDQANDPAIGLDRKVNSAASRSGGSRVQGLFTVITAISGTKISLERGILWNNFKTSLSPQLWLVGKPLREAGIQHLSTFAQQANPERNIHFQGCYNCWINNCHIQYGANRLVHTYQSARIEIRHSTFQFTTSYASNSYGVYLWYASSSLVEDNIFDTIAEACPMQSTSAGNVFAYNFVNNCRYDPSKNWQVETTFCHGGATMNLFEGNWTPNIWSDLIMAPNAWLTAFRNRIWGQAMNNGTPTEANIYPIVHEAFNRHGSYLGNILGKEGVHNAYVLKDGPHQNKNFIYVSGYSTTDHNYPGGYDPEVWQTLILKGNYNYADKAIGQSENLGGLSLGASQYYDSRPSWWKAQNWPWVDPANPSASNNSEAIQAGYRFKNGTDPEPAPQPPQPQPPDTLIVTIDITVPEGVTVEVKQSPVSP